MRKIEMVGFKESDEHFWISFTSLFKNARNELENIFGV